MIGHGERAGKVLLRWRWRIKEGREREFEEAWTDFANWTLEQKFAEQPLQLYQDMAEPRRYYALWKCGSERSIENGRVKRDTRSS